MKKLLLSSLLCFLLFCSVSCVSPMDSITKINYSNYAKIKNGMNYSEVCDILGGKGKLGTSVGYGGETLAYYSWEYDGLMGYRVIIVGFDNGRVSAKSQVGL